MTHAWLHISGGTEIVGYTFDSLDDATEFRKTYADDEQPDGSYKDVDDIPPLPEWGATDDHETDTWVLLAGQIEAVDGIGPLAHMHRVGSLFVEQPLST